MIIVMKPQAKKQDVDHIIQIIEASKGLTAHLSVGSEVTIIGVVGDKSHLNDSNLEIANGVDKIIPVTESYKLANKKFHPDPTSVRMSSTEIGPRNLTLMSGPCAIESEEQLLATAKAIWEQEQIFWGGAYKPRTSPYSFQGLEEEGLRYMKTAREETGLAVVCEVTSAKAIEAAVKYVDMLQIGARNMQESEFVKENWQDESSCPIKKRSFFHHR